MSKPRGNKKSQAQVVHKEAEIIDHLEGGIPPGKELAEAAGLPLSTLYDYISRLRAKGLSLDQTRNPEKYLALCEEQDAVLRKMEEWLLEQKIAPEVVREWRAVRKDIAELWGLDAAKKTITQSVSTTLEPTLYTWIWGLRNQVPHEVMDAWKADIEAVTAKHAAPYIPGPVKVPAHLLREVNDDSE